MHLIPPRVNPSVSDHSLIFVVTEKRDGQPDYIELVKQLGINYTFVFTAESDDLIKTLVESPVDLILLEESVGGQRGLDVCKRIKSHSVTGKIPLIFVGPKSNEIEQKALLLGAIDYISLPFQIPIVKARINNYINLKKKNDLLESLSNLDGLTNIPNRRYFNDALFTESHRLFRAKEPLGIIMIDIDFFKDFNDYYGHTIGDDCLKKVAWIMQKNLPNDNDLLARYGGEEFVVLSPNRNLEQTRLLAELLKQTVLDLAYPNVASSISEFVTISLGVASQVLVSAEAGNLLVEQADAALYRAKQRGRNCVESN